MDCRIIGVCAALCLAPGHVCVWAASPEVITEPSGFVKIAVEPGPNLMGAPFQQSATYRGIVDSASGFSPTMVTVSGTPSWTVDDFEPADGFTQYILLIRKDASETPGIEGDWWPILSNSSDTLVVDDRGEDIAPSIGSGDLIEVRRLTSIRDLFYVNSTLLLDNKDSNGSPSITEEDVIRFVEGTSFTKTIFYHDGTLGPEGFYVDGAGPFDGSTISIEPNQPIMVFRLLGTPAFDITSVGAVQTTALTHYLEPGPNPVAMPFVTDSPISGSNLLLSGWTGDSNGSPSPDEEDVIRVVTGTSFSDTVFYHDGSLGPSGWYINGSKDDDWPFVPGEGYIFYITGAQSVNWRQTPPY